MATASPLLSEDQFLCSICLEVFTEPVAIPCGHNFCKSCILRNWNYSAQAQCPLCKKDFSSRPEVNVNTFISEMAAQFKESLQWETAASGPGPQPAGDGDVVLCDICTGTGVKAVKSCLVCLMSYCEAHLAPHRRTKGLQRHKLIEPAGDLEARVCAKHDRPLETFCKTDRACVCQFCTETDHKGHHLVSLGDEYEDRKTGMRDKEARVGQLIQERLQKIAELKDGLKLSREDAEREKTAGRQVFTALIQSVERSLDQLVHAIEDAQRAREQQAEGLIAELEQEIHELTKVNSELRQLLNDADHLHVIQRSSSLSPVPSVKIWSGVRVPTSHREVASVAVSQQEERLAEAVAKLRMRIELSRLQRFAVDVTLDPETAYSKLVLSCDGKQVAYQEFNPLPSVPELACPKRFCYSGVLSRQKFSAGRFYYEVEVKGRSDWTLGVAKESINRKTISANQMDYYGITLTSGTKYRVSNSATRPSVKSRPQRVGVFVDYEGGLVSFYDVDAAALIYSFRDCAFAEDLHAFFDPSGLNLRENTDPLTICPVGLPVE